MAHDDKNAAQYATSLAIAIWCKHYKEQSPDWKPLPDLMGVLTQIDNMIAGIGSASTSEGPNNG
jgi:hypothetical protein